MNNGNWKITELNKLIKWRKDGETIGTCATRLNRSYHSVKKAALRYKVKNEREKKERNKKYMRTYMRSYMKQYRTSNPEYRIDAAQYMRDRRKAAKELTQ